MELFGFLTGISPWWWIAGAVLLGVIEMATMSFFLIWPALAALVMAAVVFVAPGLSGVAQAFLFAVLAVILTLIGRSLIGRFGDGGAPATGLNDRSAAMIGRRAKVLSFEGGEGSVEIDGIRWKAVWEGPNAIDGIVEVTAADGMRLSVRAVST